MSSAKQPDLDLGAIEEQEQEQEGGTVIKEVQFCKIVWSSALMIVCIDECIEQISVLGP